MKMTLDILYGRCEDFGDCKLWKHSTTNGKGMNPQARIDGKAGVQVRHHIFTELLGKRLRKGYILTTECGEGLCIAAGCIVSMTYGDRQRKAYADGRRRPAEEYMNRVNRLVAAGKTALNFDKARELRGRTGTNAELGREYGCGPKAISAARNGRTWRTAFAGNSVFNQA